MCLKKFILLASDKILGFQAKKIKVEGGEQSTLHYVVGRCYWKVLNFTIFFWRAYNHSDDSELVNNWAKHTGIRDLVWFQHDGALGHFVLIVNVIINTSFWVGGLIIHLQLHCHHCHGPTWPHQTTAYEDSSMKKWLKTGTTKTVNCESL